VALLLGVAFFVVPFVEMIVIFAIGPRIGWDTTVTLLVLFSAAGAWLVKREGLDTWRRIQNGLQAGRMPTTDVVDGFLVLVGGALLLCPGFVTSAVGILLILPPIRAMANGVAGDAIRTRVKRRIRTVGSRLNDEPMAPRSQARSHAPHNGAGPTAGAWASSAHADAASPYAAQAGGSGPNGMGSNGMGPNGTGHNGAAGSDSPFGTPHRAYRRPDETEPEPETAGSDVWGARVRRGPVEDFDVIDVDGEEIVFGQGELGPSGF
jgi:UPF0716 protein FxsA